MNRHNMVTLSMSNTHNFLVKTYFKSTISRKLLMGFVEI